MKDNSVCFLLLDSVRRLRQHRCPEGANVQDLRTISFKRFILHRMFRAIQDYTDLLFFSSSTLFQIIPTYISLKSLTSERIRVYYSFFHNSTERLCTSTLSHRATTICLNKLARISLNAECLGNIVLGLGILLGGS